MQFAKVEVCKPIFALFDAIHQKCMNYNYCYYLPIAMINSRVHLRMVKTELCIYCKKSLDI